jgi:glutathione S-transferase
MAIEVYWGSGSPFAWQVLLTLEVKRLEYVSHQIQFSKNEHKTPGFLQLNPRGKVPVLKYGDFVVYESLAIMKYLDDKHRQPSLFGETPEQSARIMMSVCECNSYIEQPTAHVVGPIFFGGATEQRDAIVTAANALREEYALLNARLSAHQWLVGATVTAADIVLYPQVAILQRALAKEQAAALGLKLAPFSDSYPAITQWMRNVESLPGYERTYPPHWRQ